MNSERMNEEEKIEKINQVVSDYFDQNSTEDTIAAKALMPHFIEAGIFTKDNRKGKPIRDVLRSLDEHNELTKLPLIHSERKDKNTIWYFVRSGSTYVSDAPNDTGIRKKKKVKIKQANSDEHYIINLFDELLGEKASRQHEFGYLLSDYNKNGIRKVLPVDAYYRKKNLVIEYKAITDKTETITIRDRNRSDQGKIYDARKKKGLLANHIQLMVISHSSFECDQQNKLIRNKEKDLSVLSSLLKAFNSELWSSI